MPTYENVDGYMERQFDYISSSNVYNFIWKNINNLIKANFVNNCARHMYHFNKKKHSNAQKITIFVHEIAYYGSLLTN